MFWFGRGKESEIWKMGVLIRNTCNVPGLLCTPLLLNQKGGGHQVTARPEGGSPGPGRREDRGVQLCMGAEGDRMGAEKTGDRGDTGLEWGFEGDMGAGPCTPARPVPACCC